MDMMNAGVSFPQASAGASSFSSSTAVLDFFSFVESSCVAIALKSEALSEGAMAAELSLSSADSNMPICFNIFTLFSTYMPMSYLSTVATAVFSSAVSVDTHKHFFRDNGLNSGESGNESETEDKSVNFEAGPSVYPCSRLAANLCGRSHTSVTLVRARPDLALSKLQWLLSKVAVGSQQHSDYLRLTVLALEHSPASITLLSASLIRALLAWTCVQQQSTQLAHEDGVVTNVIVSTSPVADFRLSKATSPDYLQLNMQCPPLARDSGYLLKLALSIGSLEQKVSTHRLITSKLAEIDIKAALSGKMKSRNTVAGSCNFLIMYSSIAAFLPALSEWLQMLPWVSSHFCLFSSAAEADGDLIALQATLKKAIIQLWNLVELWLLATFNSPNADQGNRLIFVSAGE